MNTNDTQCEIILRHMNEHGSITAKVATSRYRIYRLAARIADLRKRGYNIVTNKKAGSSISGRRSRYAEYRFEEEE